MTQAPLAVFETPTKSPQPARGTPGRPSGIVIIADRLSTFCRTHSSQLIAAGTCDPDATAAELGQIRDNAVAMIVDAALRSRGAAAPVPPARPGDPAWYTAVMISRPDRAAGKAENADQLGRPAGPRQLRQLRRPLVRRLPGRADHRPQRR